MAQTVLSTSSPQPSVAPIPTSSREYITLLSHYHRAEIARMAGWRDRIDLTTNWAITVVGAMLSLSLTSPTAHHGIMLFAMVLATLLLTIEARRYRFFDVFRGRVRRLERGWYSPIFLSETRPDQMWMEELGRDLQRPAFLISTSEAMSRRLRRTYAWIYLILLFAWLFKTTSYQPTGRRIAEVTSVPEWLDHAALGPIPGVLVVACVAAFYAWLLYIGLRHRKTKDIIFHGDVHV